MAQGWDACPCGIWISAAQGSTAGKFPEQLGDGWGVNGGHVNPACQNGTTLKGAILLQPAAFRGCWGLAFTGSRSKSRDKGERGARFL